MTSSTAWCAPRYKHDCRVVGGVESDGRGGGGVVSFDHNACRFIGHLDIPAGQPYATDGGYDLYIHERKWDGFHHVECVARYGDDGPEYLSGEVARRLIIGFIVRPTPPEETP